jgi:hypothetical protein
VDEQIARHLQQKEEEDALVDLQEQERKRGRLRDETLFTQATFLTQEIRTFCAEDLERQGFYTFSECDLKCFAAAFVLTAETTLGAGASEKVVSLAYTFTSADSKKWNSIRRHGFGDVVVSNDMGAAWTLFEESNNASSSSKTEPLFSIAEDSECSPHRGWIVATVACLGKTKETTVAITSGGGVAQYLNTPSYVLPLVYFDANLRYKDEIRRLLNGLSRICWDFFAHALNMETGTMPPPAKKPRGFPMEDGNEKDDDDQEESPSRDLQGAGKAKRFSTTTTKHKEQAYGDQDAMFANLKKATEQHPICFIEKYENEG